MKSWPGSSALALASVLLAGCASSRQFVAFPDQNNTIDDVARARIYVIRPTSMASAVGMDVFDGERYIGVTGPSSFLCWERDPGEALIRSKAETMTEFRLTCEAGACYYLGQHIDPGLFIARTHLRLMPEKEGLRKLEGLKPPKVTCRE